MTQGKQYAILIAASEFPNEPQLARLNCPVNDVAGMAEALTAPEIGLFAEPKQLVNQPCDLTRRAVNRVFSQAGPHDQILIYYSGHGKPDGQGNLHLALTDTEFAELHASSLGIKHLREFIDSSDCKRVGLILDCCYSGLASKGFKGSVEDQLQVTFRDRGIYILAASDVEEAAREKREEPYSLFTKHLLQGIRQSATDKDGKGWIGLGDLYEYVKPLVHNEAKQHPRAYPFGIQGNDLMIARAAQAYDLKALRELIVRLDDDLADEVYLDALRVVKENQPQRDQAYFKLLAELLAERIKPGKFSGLWLKQSGLTAPARVPAAVPKPPPEPVREAAPPAPKPVVTKPAQPASFIETVNGVPLEMIYVPGGKFTMGGNAHDDEKPPHPVTVPGFFIGKFQITQAQWKAVMGDELKPSFKGDNLLPMESISWNDAQAFCQKLTQMTRKAYRLPNEAEWEFACRAGTTGDYAGELKKLAWYIDNADRKTHPVGQKDANAFGLHDMHGNVWEWCEDVWHGNYDKAPDDGSAWMQGGDQERRVVRGGSWNDGDSLCRSAFRLSNDLGSRRGNLGFRVVVSVRTT